MITISPSSLVRRITTWPYQEPYFDLDKTSIKELTICVRIPNLPIEYYDLLLLRWIGNKIRQTIQVAKATKGVTQAKYARLCVKVDLTKPLSLNSTCHKIWGLEYESIHTVYFKCGIYEYKEEACLLAKNL